MLLILVGSTTPSGAVINPDGITEPETLGTPTGVFHASGINPNSITDTQTLGAPAATYIVAKYNGSYSSGSYGVGPYSNRVVGANSLSNAETLGAPTVTATYTLRPGSINDTDVPGGPSITVAYTSRPASLTDPETLAAPTASVNLTTAPTGITDTETLAAPSAAAGMGGTPATITELETFGVVAAVYAPFPPFPDAIADPETIGTPAARFYPSHIYPTGITDNGTIGAPSKTFKAHYNGSYGSGTYGVGNYQAMVILPAGITDYGTLAFPVLSAPAPVPPGQILPFGIVDAEEFATPTLPRPGATNQQYGAGIYGDGLYVGIKPPRDNYRYGEGEYGWGIYYGVLRPTPPDPDSPDPFGDVMGPTKPPLHILGIGPWGPHVYWRGAKNYGVAAGTYNPRPVMALPPATSKAFTLRLGEGGEARLELQFPRGSAVIMDEMDTDLWWQRKDPRTQQAEMIGRFNTSHLNLATSDTGVSCSVQLDDWQTVFSARMVLKYLTKGDPPTSMWDKGTSVISIIAWALPTNTGIDVTEATGPHPVDIGKLIQPFDLPPGTTMGDLFTNLLTITDRHWEWWIESPDDVTKPPKLRFIVGQRGSDRGVTLFDVGRGPTPIASWTRNAAESDYGNSLYYTGGVTTGQEAAGGVVEQIDAQISQYGQRDHMQGNSSVDGGNPAVLRQHAQKVLEKLADRRPNFQLNLRQGFWRGRAHIDIGDTVTLILRLGEELIQEKYRVAEISVSVDDLGLEDVSLTLGRLPISADPRSKRSPLIRIINYLRNYETPSGSMYPQSDD